MAHIPVLLQPSLDGLALESGDVFVDGTFGGGGHSEQVARCFGDSVTIIGIDLDQASLDAAVSHVSKFSRNVVALSGNFRNMDTLVGRPVNKILLDLGTSSMQIDDSGRGFTFRKKEPLLMTLANPITPETLTAREIVNNWDEENIATIIRGFGEERYAARIAHEIAEARTRAPIETTFDLVEIIDRATPASYKHGRIHPATRTFQALRIATNDELNALQHGLEAGWKILTPGGRMAVISFHSLEDRIVKRFMNEKIVAGEGERVTKKPIMPSDEEKEANPRSRSAKLRVIQKK